MGIHTDKNNKANNRRPSGITKLAILFVVIFLLTTFLYIGWQIREVFAILGDPASLETTAATGSTFSFGAIGLLAASVLPIAFIVLIAFVILKMFGRLHGYSRQKKEEYDDKVTLKAVSEIIPDAQFSRNRCILPGTLREYGILPAYDDYVTDGMLHYRKNEKDYYCSNIHLTKESTDSDGNTTDNTCYRGQAYTVNYRMNLPGSVRIFSTRKIKLIRKESRSGYPAKRPGETKIETENTQFNENFDVYATNEQSAFFVLTPLVMEQLLEMKRRYEQVGVYINGNQLVITLKTNRTLLAARWYKPEKEADALESAKRDLREILETAELLENSINGSTDHNFTSTWH